VGLIAFAVIVVAAVGLFKVWPTAFVPPEDQGYLFVAYFLPDAASLDRTAAVGGRAAAFMSGHPAVANVTQVDGYSLIDSQNKTNNGVLFVSLKDYDERKAADMGARAIIMEAMKSYGNVQEGLIFPVNPPSIPGLGVTAGFQMWIQQKGGGNYAQLVDVAKAIVAKAKARPELTRVNMTVSATGQQLLADVDREKAEVLGVPVQDVYSTLQTMFGSMYVSQFPKDSRLWQVILQAEPKYRMTPEDIGRFYVRNRDRQMVPLSGLVSTRYVSGPDLVTRFNNYPAVQITGSAPIGVSSGESLRAIREVAEEVMPSNYSFAWSGEAREEVAAGSTSAIAFVFGLIFVFLILAAQYESWSLPVGVLMAVPFALLGALLAIVLRRSANDLYFQIGLLTLIGLAAKNAILIVEFAVEKNRHEGMSFFDAAVEAARLRLRPIVMTSFAFILGVVPLAIATGASANSRHSIGTGVIGGTLAATVIAIFFIPMFFWLLETMSHKLFPGKKPAAPPAAPAQGGSAPAAAAHDVRRDD
jgi:multidrug efflux pump